MQRKNAGLAEVYKLYTFTLALPKIVPVLEELVVTSSGEGGSSPATLETVNQKFIAPFQRLAQKFAVYQQLIETVVDFNQLPDLVINAKHDPALKEIRDEMDDIEKQAEDLLDDARSSWASFADVKLETNGQYGFFFRSTKGDDEKQLRANNKRVKILAIQKVIHLDENKAMTQPPPFRSPWDSFVFFTVPG
jgi:DNA mismatch repair ATPase MutS